MLAIVALSVSRQRGHRVGQAAAVRPDDEEVTGPGRRGRRRQRRRPPHDRVRQRSLLVGRAEQAAQLVGGDGTQLDTGHLGDELTGVRDQPHVTVDRVVAGVGGDGDGDGVAAHGSGGWSTEHEAFDRDGHVQHVVALLADRRAEDLERTVEQQLADLSVAVRRDVGREVELGPRLGAETAQAGDDAGTAVRSRGRGRRSRRTGRRA